MTSSTACWAAGSVRSTVSRSVRPVDSVLVKLISLDVLTSCSKAAEAVPTELTVVAED